MFSQVAIKEFSEGKESSEAFSKDLAEASTKEAAREFIKLPNTVLAAAVGLVYFLAALLSYGLALQSEGLAVFWPASGVSSGILIALGSRARWPVVCGVSSQSLPTISSW